MNLDRALQTFFAESYSLLDEMESILLACRAQPPADEALNALFRAMHTIKGSAGLFAFMELAQFTHKVESLLDALRARELAFDALHNSLLLRCHDHVQHYLEALEQHQPAPDDEQAWLMQTLNQALQPPPDAQAPTQALRAEQDWLLSMHFAADCLKNGIDPGAVFSYLQTIGQLLGMRALTAQLPGGEDFNPETLYLHFEALLRSQAELDTIQAAFALVGDTSQIHIVPAQALGPEPPGFLSPYSPELVSAILSAWQAFGLYSKPEPQSAAPSSTPASPAIDLLSKGFTPATPRPLIKVDTSKLDELIDLVGELVIADAASQRVALQSQHPEVVDAAQTISALIEQIRTRSLSLRMVAMGEVFTRFPRVIHDLSKILNKSIALHIQGADTELDKSMIDKLTDPLMHLLRNACDHGIESSEQRLKQGKPSTGHIWLNAYHDADSVVVEISDDGGGIDQQWVLAQALAQGIITADSKLSQAEVYALLFQPGFSTREQITQLSGRGVGLDVVRSNIEKLHGSIAIKSTLQQGTTFRIRLPLTLAIINGLLVGVADSTFVIPLESVIECLTLAPAQSDLPQHNRLDLRGELLPLLRLAEFFQLPSSSAAPKNVVVVRFGEHKAGLVVDALPGEFKTVIKPLGYLFRHFKAVSGSTILGNGEVALILDINAMIHIACQQQANR